MLNLIVKTFNRVSVSFVVFFAYGIFVLIDGGKTFRDFIRANKESQKLIKKLIAQVSGVAVPIGPYESKTVNRASANAEESLRKLEQLGLEVSIEDSERKKR